MSPKDGNPLCCVLAPKSGLWCYCHLVVMRTYCRKSILKGKQQNRNFQEPGPASQEETTLTKGKHKVGQK